MRYHIYYIIIAKPSWGAWIFTPLAAGMAHWYAYILQVELLRGYDVLLLVIGGAVKQ